MVRFTQLLNDRLARKTGSIALFIFIFIFPADNIFAQGQSQVKVISKDLTLNDSKIEGIISKMTLEEKIDMLHGNGMFTSPGIERLGIPELKYTDGPCGIREELGKNSWNSLKLTTD